MSMFVKDDGLLLLRKIKNKISLLEYLHCNYLHLRFLTS